MILKPMIFGWMMMWSVVCSAQNIAPDDPDLRWSRLRKQLTPHIGEQDTVMVSGPDGLSRIAIHQDRGLVPASIIKILTALTALEILGAKYRFPTDFFLSENGDLTIKGYGDPLQISEQLEAITGYLSKKIDRIENLLLDDSYMSQPIIIPGRGRSDEPYDAPNGALCVNFNTVAFKRQKGRWVSAEPQTPLLPLVFEKIEASGLEQGRITLAGNAEEGLRYTGELYRYFFSQAGVAVHGRVAPGIVDPRRDRLVWRYQSPYDLERTIAHLLAYSNNFIANQLLLAVGAHIHGSPATLEKGLMVLADYCTENLGLPTTQLVEGSGLSRKNRISARSMIKVLDRFVPYHTTLRRRGDQWYKTGTLNGIHTRAGYLNSGNGDLYRFVIMLNTTGKNTDRVMQIIERALR